MGFFYLDFYCNISVPGEPALNAMKWQVNWEGWAVSKVSLYYIIYISLQAEVDLPYINRARKWSFRAAYWQHRGVRRDLKWHSMTYIWPHALTHNYFRFLAALSQIITGEIRNGLNGSFFLKSNPGLRGSDLVRQHHFQSSHFPKSDGSGSRLIVIPFSSIARRNCSFSTRNLMWRILTFDIYKCRFPFFIHVGAFKKCVGGL